jgi:hypothetical protein
MLRRIFFYTVVEVIYLFLALAPAPSAPRLPPVLAAREDEEDTNTMCLAISKVDVAVQISGCLAETRMTMVFQNDGDQNLEGDLYFPLPEGATVSGYALDVNDVMVDGVAAPKLKARQVFETLKRRAIDPGLVEWTQGNIFKTRVFPILAKKSRTIRVSYVSALGRLENRDIYQLPLKGWITSARTPRGSWDQSPCKPTLLPILGAPMKSARASRCGYPKKRSISWSGK